MSKRKSKSPTGPMVNQSEVADSKQQIPWISGALVIASWSCGIANQTMSGHWPFYLVPIFYGFGFLIAWFPIGNHLSLIHAVNFESMIGKAVKNIIIPTLISLFFGFWSYRAYWTEIPVFIVRVIQSNSSSRGCTFWSAYNGILSPVNMAIYVRATNREAHPIIIERCAARILSKGRWTKLYRNPATENIFIGEKTDNLRPLEMKGIDFSNNTKNQIQPGGTTEGWVIFEYPDGIDDAPSKVEVILVDDDGNVGSAWNQEIPDSLHGTELKVGPKTDLSSIPVGWYSRGPSVLRK